MTPKQVVAQARTLLTNTTWRQGNYDGLHPERAYRIVGKMDVLEAIWEASAHNPDDANATITLIVSKLPAGTRSVALFNDTTTLVQLRNALQTAAA